MRFGLLMAAVLAVGPAVWADTLETEDGKTYIGELTRVKDGWEIKQADGTKVSVADDQTKSVAKDTGGKSAMESTVESLRKTAEKMTHVDEVLHRYQNFVKINPQARDLVKEDMALWQLRKDQKMVKVGSQWLGVEERRKMLEGLIPMIDKARQKLEKYPKADIAPELSGIFAVDSVNPSGMYLKGLMLLNQGQVGAARGVYLDVLSRVPAHGATLNNLGVIAYRNRSYMQAMKYFNAAMDKLPESDSIRQTVLDNLAEALAAVPYAQRTDDYFKVADKFEKADEKFQKKMEDKGLYRWGSKWVKSDQVDKINASQDRSRQTIEALEREYEQLRHQLTRVNDELSAADIDYRRLFVGRTFLSDQGVIIINQNLSILRAQQRIRSLEDQQNALLMRMDQFWQRAALAQQQIEGPSFSNETKAVGVEGTPLTLPGGGNLIAG